MATFRQYFQQNTRLVQKFAHFRRIFFFWRNVDEVGEMLPHLAPRRKVKREVCQNGQVIHAPLDESLILFSRCTGTIPSSWQ